jgi:hypothetical protein
MSNGALVCQVAVTAGVIPGVIEKQYTKAWYWTSSDQENMMQMENEALQNEYRMKWIAMQGESREYAASLEDPRRVNWIRRDWMWM